MPRHRRTASWLIGTFVLTLILAFSGCTTILGDFDVGGATAVEAGVDAGRVNGEACQAGNECGSGVCADGVCCDAACNGTCESCALEGAKGTCSPIPAGTDPENECRPEPRPDAGVIVDDGGSDASSDGGRSVNVPDGGLASDETKCRGACDGNRKCAFPGRETVCGTQFCNTPSEGAAFSCDQKGRCDLELVSCGSFTCKSNACVKTCSATADCADTHFCNASGTCQTRLDDGNLCTVTSQCKSGFCVDGVCCNSECDPANFTGATCKKPGSEGKCSCSLSCSKGCRLFYKDTDGDGHGDETAPLSTAQVGCAEDLPPSGFADVRDDCNDNDARVFPGQTAFFETGANGTGSFDFNCDKTLEKETAEYPKGSCRFCAPWDKAENLECTVAEKACYAAGQQANLTCKLGKSVSGYTCDGPKGNAYTNGFVEEVGCGQPGSWASCGSCLLKGGAPTKSIVDATKVQRCR